MTTPETTTETTPAIAERDREYTATAPLALAWGLQPPPGANLAWGARAIYTENRHAPSTRTKRGTPRKRITEHAFRVELLWDRQGAARRGEMSELDLEALSTWLNTKGLKALRDACTRQYITTDCDEEITIESNGYAIKASPRESCGYLYIVAWKI